ncbi:PREDICTED: uncharacterized protein LOC109205322 [Nicotiana attenuata]|uniref:uncharacterized protein LOC109205322 n=1 Tax=Nicotiana attenuata TaxID=49451 RepID=UPI000905004B|nr:PREDICTED: uncharacterized protein LOC109205322 [Nicotiana attenuata]
MYASGGKNDCKDQMLDYQISIFLIPKKVLQLITSACRTFLWTGQCATSRRALVAWERLCMPKSAGGLNIIEFQTWNKAAISKLLWAITAKKDTLWVQWIHSFYIKGRSISTMETPKQACWLVRKIFDARKWYGSNDLCGELQQRTHAGKFMIKKAYKYLLPQYPRAIWKNLNMIPCSVPRADVEETHTHLFFECDYSRQMWSSFLRWTGESKQAGTWEEEIARLTTKQCNSKAHAEVLGWLLAATVYYVRSERNARRFQEQ